MSKELDKLVQKIYDAMNAATAYADKHGEEFSFTPSYGMGGYYYPQKVYTKDEALELLRSSKPLTDEERANIAIALNSEDSYRETGWVSSSHNC